MDPPAVWPRLLGTPRPERAEAPVSSLSGVGPALEKKLAKQYPELELDVHEGGQPHYPLLLSAE